MAVVQRGSATMTGATLTLAKGVATGFDDTVDPTKTILYVTHRQTDSSSMTYAPRWTLTDGNTITITRSNSDATDIEIFWELATRASGLVVQHIPLTIANTAQVGTAAIDAASFGGRRYIILGGGEVSDTTPNDHLARLKFDSDDSEGAATQISANRTGTSAEAKYNCQVVEDVNCTVQEVTHILAATELTSSVDTISEVAIAKSALFGSSQTDLSTADEQNESFWDMYQSSTTAVTFTRGTGTSGDFTFTYYVVTFTDDTVVRHNAVDFSTSDTTINTTIAAVVLAQSIASASGATVWGSSHGWGKTSIHFQRLCVTSQLTSTTNHAQVRQSSAVDTDCRSQVIQFTADAAAGPVKLLAPSHLESMQDHLVR